MIDSQVSACHAVSTAHRPVRCSFLVIRTRNEPKKASGEALTAKAFVTAKINRHYNPAFEPPSPGPHPAPVGGPVLFDFYSMPRCFSIKQKMFDLD